jgi:16S rRNA (uracil1498-N3)-methyltransferase
MTRRRFYAPPIAFGMDEKSAILGPEETRHLRDVLRLHSGDEIYVFDGAGHEFHCAVETIAKDSTALRVISEVETTRPESPLDLTLAIALLKGEKFELVIQKATELGIKRIVPLETERADVRLRDNEDAQKKLARWQRIALEAAKQTGRAFVPEVSAPLTLSSLLMLKDKDRESLSDVARLMFAERAGDSFGEATKSFIEEPNDMVAVVGPEGGWADEEIELARANGWKIVTLGGRTLRAETAAIVVVSLLQHRFGDLA